MITLEEYLEERLGYWDSYSVDSSGLYHTVTHFGFDTYFNPRKEDVLGLLIDYYATLGYSWRRFVTSSAIKVRDQDKEMIVWVKGDRRNLNILVYEKDIN